MDQVACSGLSSASHWTLTRVFHHCSCLTAKHHHLHHLHHSEHQSQHKTYYMLGINLRTLSGLTHLLFITDPLRWFLIAFPFYWEGNYSHRGTCIHRAQHHKISKHWSQAQTLWPLFLTTMLSSSSINKEIGTQERMLPCPRSQLLYMPEPGFKPELIKPMPCLLCRGNWCPLLSGRRAD